MQEARSERAEQRTSPAEDVCTSTTSIGDAHPRCLPLADLVAPPGSTVPVVDRMTVEASPQEKVRQAAREVFEPRPPVRCIARLLATAGLVVDSAVPVACPIGEAPPGASRTSRYQTDRLIWADPKVPAQGIGNVELPS